MNPLSHEEYYYKVDNMVLSSCQLLRKLFETRWKKESGLDYTEVQWAEYIEGHGQSVYNKALKAQKDIIAKGCIEEWDISVLSTVLLNFGNWRYYKTENDAVRQLTILRNDVAHHPSKKLNQEEYDAKVDLFRVSLKRLGLQDEEVEQMITKAGRSSSVAALKANKRLYDRAKGLMKSNKYDKAVGCYDEAITMPSLLPIHQATAYEKRAECYFKYAEFKKLKQLDAIEVINCCNQALKDANQALEINEKSWRAHFTLAQTHRLKGDLDTAVEHYRQSLSISPTAQHVKNEWEACLALMSIKKGGMSHLQHDSLPKNLTEKIAQYSKYLGRKITEKEFLEEIPNAQGALVPGQDFVARGHQYRCGWGVRPNEVDAVRFFTKAADLGNIEGMHSLATCYFNGTGVAQDFSKVFQIYLKAAKMSPDTPGRATLVSKNVGVADSQFALGQMYELGGVVVKQDYAQAAMWYKKAAENGEGRAAHRLGIFYSNGWGVPRSEKMAETHWLQAIRFHESEAAHALVGYYKHHLEPEKALNMFETGRKLEQVLLTGISKEEFMAEIKEVTQCRDEQKPELLAFEKKHELDTKGLTFVQRIRRMLNFADGKLQESNDSQGEGKLPYSENAKDWKLLEIENNTNALHLHDDTAKSTAATSTHQEKDTNVNVLGILQRKPYLDSPIRKRLILSQRELINEMISFPKDHIYIDKQMGICLPTLVQGALKLSPQMKHITIQDMSPTTEAIYQDSSIALTIIDEPNLKLFWIQLIAEDENGDVVRIFIHDVEKTEENLKRFKFGRRISILNPYMQVRNQERDIGIRVDDRDCIVYSGGAQDMCRFCGQENAPHKCSSCKKAYYCSRECQTLDWKVLKHKLVCSQIKNNVP